MRFAAIILISPLAVLGSALPQPDQDQGLVERSTVNCKIVNVSSYANCRSGPGTSYDSIYALAAGASIPFQCYKRGTCVDGNCTWDRYHIGNGKYCYVSGTLTDSHCTIAALGAC